MQKYLTKFLEETMSGDVLNSVALNTVTMGHGMIDLHLLSPHHPLPYNPLADPVYMSPAMLAYFEEKLMALLAKLKKQSSDTLLHALPNITRESDYIDQGTNEELRQHQSIFQEHEDRLRHQIEAALKRIGDGSYGYCEETGEPIGVRRLEAVPQTRYCVKVQQEKEQGHKG
jgi:DnaK suppressor protein